MDMGSILTIVGGAAAAFFGAKLLGKGDTRVEERRRTAVDLATWAKGNGLGVLNNLLTDYAVGDYSGMVSSVRQIAGIVRDPAESQAALDRFLQVQLSRQLETEAGKESLVSFIESKLGIKIDRKAITIAPIEIGETVAEEVAK